MMIKISTRIMIFAVTLAVLATIIQAQETGPVEETGGMGYSIFGQTTIAMDDMNTRLESKGYTGLSDKFFSVGGGGHSILKEKWIIGGEAHVLLGDDAVTGNYTSSILINYGFANFGIVAWSMKDLRVYPLLGLGGGSMNLKIRENLSSLSMDEVLDNPERGVNLVTGGVLLNLALGVDYLISFGEDEEGRGGMMLGFRAGYTLAPFKGGWTMDDIEITGAPEIGITGPYIRLMIGGGGFSRNK
ncbi:hypothetical protein ACFL4L_03075 [bacterium]